MERFSNLRKCSVSLRNAKSSLANPLEVFCSIKPATIHRFFKYLKYQLQPTVVCKGLPVTKYICIAHALKIEVTVFFDIE